MTERNDREQILRMFTSISPVYDRLNRLLSLGIDRHWRRVAASELGCVAEGSRILDICAGTGDMAVEVSRVLPGSSVIITDYCLPMLKKARAKTHEIPGLRLVLCDAICLPFEDETFDGATCAFGLRNLTDLDHGLRELARVLRKQAPFCCLEFMGTKSRGLRRLPQFYFRRIVPVVGRILSGSPDAYRYLAESARKFIGIDAMIRKMEQSGFERVSARRLISGQCILFRGLRSDFGAGK